jgi:hypothetical protein
MRGETSPNNLRIERLDRRAAFTPLELTPASPSGKTPMCSCKEAMKRAEARGPMPGPLRIFKDQIERAFVNCNFEFPGAR